jgi:cob(I)alamin adenosyltransferase
LTFFIKKSPEFRAFLTSSLYSTVKDPVWLMSEDEKAAYRQEVSNMLEEGINCGCDLLVIDEACSAVTTGMLNLDYLTDLIKNKPEGREIVLTGRDPDIKLIELADYVTEMKKEKHPFDSGVGARVGIEK